MVLGHQKGHDLKERQVRNFGMPRPEGYRKAQRLALLAEKFQMPVVTLVDTPGAFPGADAEEGGQAGAIARTLQVFAGLSVPTVAVVIGEGGSGGALALALCDRVYMLENAIYSVITPEACAAILWRDAGQAAQAAEALRLTAPDLYRLGVIDLVIPEPRKGAHKHHRATAKVVARQVQADCGRSRRSHLKSGWGAASQVSCHGDAHARRRWVVARSVGRSCGFYPSTRCSGAGGRRRSCAG